MTIYLDEETEKKMRAAARSAGLSQSKWIAKLIQGKTAEAWPENVVQLAGAWKDVPAAEEIGEGLSKDIEREPY